MKKVFLTIVLTILLFSCSEKEKVINSEAQQWTVLISTNEDTPKVELRAFPQNEVIINDIFNDKLGFSLNKPVTRIIEFRSNLYLICPEDNKIFVLKKSDFSKIAIYDFSSDNLKPSDITFPNATDAYVSFSNSNSVTLIDITVGIIVRRIDTEINPIGIASSGNQIFISNQGSSSVSIVDSRTKNQEQIISVPPYPSFVNIIPNGFEAVIVSLGNGKVNQNEEKTPSFATYIDIEKRTILAQVEIGNSIVKSTNQIPRGFVSTPYNWGFIITETNLFRLDYKNRTKISSVTSKEFLSIEYSTEIDKLILIRKNNNNNQLIIANPKTGIQEEFFDLPISSNYAFSL